MLRTFIVFSCCVLTMAASAAANSTAEISAPDAVAAGGTLEIMWSGERPQGGRFQVVSATGEPIKGGAHGYYQGPDKVIRIAAPLLPGEYGVALATGGEYLALQTFAVTAVEATLSVPERVEVNATIEVTFTGPRYSSDIIAITEVGGTARSGSYTYPGNTKIDKTVSLRAPLLPGTYDVIYLMRSEVLARTSVIVDGTEATLAAAKTIQVGADLTIQWSGPNNSGDLISLVAPGASARSPVYGYTGNSTNQHLVLTMPETPGSFELVYFTGSAALTRQPLEITEVSATLAGPNPVLGGQAFEVTWTGPGNHADRIIMVAADAEAAGPFAALAYVVAEQPAATLIAPKQEGSFALHYLTRKGRSLARMPIDVLPPPAKPGRLKITAAPEILFGANAAVEIILDASGSMLKRQGDKRRIDIAKATISALLEDTIPAGTPLALRAFGHREADSCRTDLEIALTPLDPRSANHTVASINAINLAKTPIAASLAKVQTDLRGVTGERIVVLVTDGEETCDGDPALAIRALQSQAGQLRVNIVGYAIDDAGLQETFASWAALGGGQYLDAADADQLGAAMRQALALPFSVHLEDQLQARGVTGDQPLELAAGDYTVRYRRDGVEHSKAVSIRAEQLLEVALP